MDRLLRVDGDRLGAPQPRALAMALETYLRMPELTRRLGIARSTVYKLMQQDGFPKPLKITPRAVAWSQQDIEDYLRRKTAHGSD